MEMKFASALALLLMLSLAFGSEAMLQQISVAPGEAYHLPDGSGQYIYVYQTSPGFTLNAKWAEVAVLSEYAKLSDGSTFRSFPARLAWENGSLKEISLEGAYRAASPERLEVTDKYYGTVYNEENYFSRAVFTPALRPHPCPGSCERQEAMRVEFKLLDSWFVISNIAPNSSDPYVALGREKKFGIINVGDELIADGLVLKLSDISIAGSGSDWTHPAIFDIITDTLPAELQIATNDLGDSVFVTASYTYNGEAIEDARCSIDGESGLPYANGHYEKIFAKNPSQCNGTSYHVVSCSKPGYGEKRSGFYAERCAAQPAAPSNRTVPIAQNVAAQAAAQNVTAPQPALQAPQQEKCAYRDPSIKILERRRVGTDSLTYTVRIRGLSTGDGCKAKNYSLAIDSPPELAVQLQGSASLAIGNGEIFRHLTVHHSADAPKGEHYFNVHLISNETGRRIGSDAAAYVYNEVPEVAVPFDSVYSKEVNGIPLRVLAYSSDSRDSADISILRLIDSGQVNVGSWLGSGGCSLELLSLERGGLKNKDKLSLRLSRAGFSSYLLDAEDGDIIPIEYADGKKVLVRITGTYLNGTNRFAEISLYGEEKRQTIAVGEKLFGQDYALEYEGVEETDGRPVARLAVFKASAPVAASPPAIEKQNETNIFEWLAKLLGF